MRKHLVERWKIEEHFVHDERNWKKFLGIWIIIWILLKNVPIRSQNWSSFQTTSTWRRSLDSGKFSGTVVCPAAHTFTHSRGRTQSSPTPGRGLLNTKRESDTGSDCQKKANIPSKYSSHQEMADISVSWRVNNFRFLGGDFKVLH